MTTKTFRALSAFAFFALALSPLVACTMSDSDEGVGEQTQAASQLREPARTPPPPQDPSTTLAAPTGIAEGIFCTLCEAQGCLCSGDQCIECGQHLTSAPPTRR